MAVVALYLSTLVLFLLLESIWLLNVMRPLFDRHVGGIMVEDVRWAAAAGFYLIYAAGIVHFVSLPALREAGPGTAAVNGALLGLLVYGAYEATNMATLKGWNWSMVFADMAGGAVSSAIVAAASVWLVRTVGLATP